MNISHRLFLFAFSMFFIVSISAQSSVDFSVDKSTGCGALANIQFTDLSTGSVTSWHWDFGNNTTSTLQNPTASYNSPGQYTVTLTVTGPNGSLTETKNNYIQVFNRPESNFTPLTTAGCTPLNVQFNNSSIAGDAGIQKYVWDFGDGSPENNQVAPNHTYNSAGSFTVSLQVIDSNSCFHTKVFNSIVVNAQPNVGFSSSNSASYCSAPYIVNFINHTQPTTNTTYLWDFGDGNTSTQANPSHTYNSMGKYDVTLIAENNQCKDTLKLFEFVTLEPIAADFTPSSKAICLGESITFNNNSAGSSTYRWEFGDGNSSSAPNPTHTYSDSGYYVVKLKSSSGTTCVDNYSDTIYVQKVIADFEVLEDTACSFPTDITFINNSINGTSFKWILGRNIFNTFSTKDTAFKISQLGHIDDTLVATSSLGCIDTLVKLQNRFHYDPTPDIHFFPEKGCDTLEVNFSFNHIVDTIVQQDWSIIEIPGITSTQKNFQYSFTNHGDYNVVLETINSRGCLSTDVIEVKVGKKFEFDLDIPDTICAGDTFYFIQPTLDTLVDVEHSVNIFWPSETVLSSLSLEKEDTTMYVFPNPGLAYIEQKVMYNGCLSSAFDTVFIKGPIATFNVIANDCQSLIFDLESRMIDVHTFYWDFGDGSARDSVNPNPTHTFPSSNNYIVTLTSFNSDSSCMMVDSQEVVATPPPFPIINVVDTNIVCTADTIFFNSFVSGNYDSLKWVLNDSVYSDSSHIYLTSDTAFKDSVYLKAINNNGCFGITSHYFEFVKPEPDFTTDYSGGCLPLNVHFINLTNSEHEVIDWRWNIDPVGQDSIFEPVININSSMVVSAELTVTDTLGCRNTIKKDSIAVIEKNNLIFWTSDRHICLGDTVQFENFSTLADSNYIWYFGDGDSSISYNSGHMYQQAGEYDVSLSYIDNQGCTLNLSRAAYISVENIPIADFVADVVFSECTPLPVNFTDISGDNAIVKWNWDFGDGSTSIFQDPFHSYTKPGKFDVQLTVETQNGCTNSIVKPEYIETSGPTAEINVFPDTACINDSFTFEMLNPKEVVNYQWNLGDSSASNINPITHIYNITGQIPIELIFSDSGNVCTDYRRDTIFIYETKADFIISNTTVCEAEEIQFQNLSQGYNHISWDFGDGNSSNIFEPAHTYSSPGNYTVKLSVEGDFGCTDTIIKNITVNPVPDITLTADTHVCPGDTVQLLASGGNIYSWSPSDFLSNNSIHNPLSFPDTSMEYKVVVGNIFSCFDSNYVTVNVPMPPSIDLPEDTSIIIGEYLDYINTDLGPQYIYTWSPTEGLSCSDCSNPIAQPLQTTSYILNIKDPFGCYSVYDTLLIEVKVEFSLNVPNAFTPNSDGNNDIIYAKGWGIKELKEFKIYNRWGELVFETTDINIGWDGTYKGKPQDIETYVYIVRALMFNDEIISKKGNISLLR